MQAKELDLIAPYIKDQVLEHELDTIQMKKQLVLANKMYKSKVPANLMKKEEDKMDKYTAELFEVVDVLHGDESMSVKPWLGAIRDP